MEKQIINPAGLAEPRGFNHGILVTGGRLLFVAGQDASDDAGHIVGPGDLVAQFDRALRNMHSIVHEAGGTMQDIVRLTIYVRDRDGYTDHLKLIGEVFRTYFGGYYPAAALLEVSRLFNPEALVELEATAVLAE